MASPSIPLAGFRRRQGEEITVKRFDRFLDLAFLSAYSTGQS